MDVQSTTTMTIDTDLLNKQRALIGSLIGSLDSRRLGACIQSDRTTLLGIQGILDAVADGIDGAKSIDEVTLADLVTRTVRGRDYAELVSRAESDLYEFWSSPEGADDLAAHLADEAEYDDSFSHLDDYEGPECPGCDTPGNCEDCVYQYNTDIDPVCEG